MAQFGDLDGDPEGNHTSHLVPIAVFGDQHSLTFTHRGDGLANFGITGSVSDRAQSLIRAAGD
jgi:hypothetical protein